MALGAGLGGNGTPIGATANDLFQYLDSTDFAFADALHRLLAQHDAEKTDERFRADGLELTVSVEEKSFKPLCEALREASRGQVRIGRPERV